MNMGESKLQALVYDILPSTTLQSQIELVVVQAVVTPVQGRVGGAAGGVVDVTAVAGRDGGGTDVTAVGGRAGAGAAVSSDVDVVSGTALVIEVEVVGCAPVQQCHSPTGYSRRGSVAGVDAFRVFCYWQQRGRHRGLVPGCGRVCRCE